MRIERKFTTDSIMLEKVKNQLKGIGYSTLYPKRRVSSLYYDTFNLDLFQASENGNLERRKIRLRFYNQDPVKAFIEYKQKYGERGWKENFEIDSLHPLIKLKSPQFKETKIPYRIESIYKPIIGVSYLRSYLISPSKEIRVTFDSKLLYGKVLRSDNHLQLNTNLSYEVSVIEIKTGINIKCGFNSLKSVFGLNSLVCSKFSKYCTGIKITC